jgi:hypothetical protein
MNVQAAAGCTARAQSRIAPAPGIDPRDYIECFDSGTSTFSTMGPSTSFNDQVLRVTTADLLPGIEASIAVRIEREIVPLLKTVYADPKWGSGISAANPLFPYPAPFSDPATSNYQGAAVTVLGAPQGLLPFNQTQGLGCAGPRCIPMLVDWSSGTAPVSYKNGGYGSIDSQTCSWNPSAAAKDFAQCEGVYREDGTSAFTLSQQMRIEMEATFINVAMGLRVLIDPLPAFVEARDNTCAPTCPWILQAVTQTVMMNNGSVLGKPAGSMTITFGAWLPNIDVMGWNTIANYRIRLGRSVTGDHPLLDVATAGSAAWFVRNEWYRHLYYAPAERHTATYLPTPSCTSGGTCLSVTNVAPANNLRAILILMGRRLTPGPPSGNPADYLEYGNASLDTVFERRAVSRAPSAPFNDRIVVLDTN